MTQSRQLSQKLFLKCSLPGTKWGKHPTPPCSSAPQQGAYSGTCSFEAARGLEGGMLWYLTPTHRCGNGCGRVGENSTSSEQYQF